MCRLEQQSVERYLDNNFYENVNSPRWREDLRRSLGFCHEHAWLGVEKRLGDALGYSILYRDLIHSILNQWDENKSPRRSLLERVRGALTPRKPCPVCEKRNETREMYLSVLGEQMMTAEMVAALEESDGLCLPHLQRALEQVREEAGVQSLLRVHRQKLEGLGAELSEFIRKNDYQAIEEGFGNEGDAWLRAIGMLVGKRK